MNIILLLLSSFVSSTYSFTNGTLLPHYLCGVLGDGYPKSVGELLPYLPLGNVKTPYNQFPIGEGTVPILIKNGVNNPDGNALASNAQKIIGSFHNGNPVDGYIVEKQNSVVIVPTAFTNLTTGIL